MAAQLVHKLYICPGETHPITRSVHLSRLAAYYPACRSCPFRADAGELAGPAVQRLENARSRRDKPTLFTSGGVRGIYLNEIGRRKADRLAAALASLLWDASPLVGRKDGSKRGGRRSRPLLVVGHDERPSSPDIVTGVVAGSRRMGCQVIDISLSTQACFCFTVAHVQAQAGVYVTGAGCGPSWTGMNFAGPGAMPLMRQGGGTQERLTLERLERRLGEPLNRPTRHAGTHRTFQALIPYEASLWKHFHALRPLQVAFGCSSRLVRRTLERIFGALPCRLVPVEIPLRARDPLDPGDADVNRVSRAVRESQSDLGLLIDDDGCRCSFFDEQGVLVAPIELTRLIAIDLQSEQPGAGVALEQAAAASLQEEIEAVGGTCVAGGSTSADMFRAMHENRAVFGGGAAGRYWFGESIPTCDAVLTVARVLQALSRSDAPFSALIGKRCETAA